MGGGEKEDARESTEEYTPDIDADSAPKVVHPRSVFSWSVSEVRECDNWVATISTGTKKRVPTISSAGKTKSLSFPDSFSAREYAISHAPPIMIPFQDSRDCAMCQLPFDKLKMRLPKHCRNCGVCVCNSCSVRWPSIKVPNTFNFKGEKNINVCTSCDWISTSFKRALEQGSLEAAVAINATGNLNLRTHVAKMSDELLLPIHLAVMSGSLELFEWLVDVHKCPISGDQFGLEKDDKDPYRTSKGTSVLDLAISLKKKQIVRYLTESKKMTIDDTNLDRRAALAALEKIASCDSTGGNDEDNTVASETLPTFEDFRVGGRTYAYEDEQAQWNALNTACHGMKEKDVKKMQREGSVSKSFQRPQYFCEGIHPQAKNKTKEGRGMTSSRISRMRKRSGSTDESSVSSLENTTHFVTDAGSECSSMIEFMEDEDADSLERSIYDTVIEISSHTNSECKRVFDGCGLCI